MIKTLILNLFAKDVAAVVAFIQRLETHLKALAEKEFGKAGAIRLQIAKLEEAAIDAEHRALIALGLSKSATAAVVVADTTPLPVVDATSIVVAAPVAAPAA